MADAAPHSSPSTPSTQSLRSLSHQTALQDRGLLLNEGTGRAVKVGGSTYQRLLAEGYQVGHASQIAETVYCA